MPLYLFWSAPIEVVIAPGAVILVTDLKANVNAENLRSGGSLGLGPDQHFLCPGERLGVLDPFDFSDIEQLRDEIFKIQLVEQITGEFRVSVSHDQYCFPSPVARAPS